MIISNDVKYIGVDDYNIDLFEGIYRVPNGISYNSYVILYEKIAVMDTVDAAFSEVWRRNLKEALAGRKPDYLIVQHMEPDHSANVLNLLKEYPETIVVASRKAFAMMKNYFGTEFEKQRLIVSDKDMLCLGKHTLTFVSALMVHWPEVIMTYDDTDKILFSADGFGTFGALLEEQDWIEEARRYYFGIVGKYGASVQRVLEKIKAMDIQTICPLHGGMLSGNLKYYLNKYDTWSKYKAEEEGVLLALIENGSWMPVAAKLMQEKFSKSKNICFAQYPVKIMSTLTEDDMVQLELLAQCPLCSVGKEFFSEMDA